jgi:hypothetical protein
LWECWRKRWCPQRSHLNQRVQRSAHKTLARRSRRSQIPPFALALPLSLMQYSIAHITPHVREMPLRQLAVRFSSKFVCLCRICIYMIQKTSSPRRKSTQKFQHTLRLSLARRLFGFRRALHDAPYLHTNRGAIRVQ